MNHRERWTVYPLLFLTLGLVMRDRLESQAMGPQTTSGRIRELVIVDANNDAVYTLSEDGWSPHPPPTRPSAENVLDQIKKMLGEAIQSDQRISHEGPLVLSQTPAGQPQSNLGIAEPSARPARGQHAGEGGP